MNILTAIGGTVQYGIDVTQNLLRIVMLVVLTINEFAKSRCKIFNTFFAAKRIGFIEESGFGLLIIVEIIEVESG